MFSRNSLAFILATVAGCSGADDYNPTTSTSTIPSDVDEDGFAESDGDCDDEDDKFYPGATDVVGDGKDQNCDDTDGVDDDHDGHASAATGGDDCDDANDAISPSDPEIGWDGIDQDCDDGDLHDFIEVSTGAAHTCALDSTGTLHCWGSDEHGQSSFHPTDAGWKHVSSGAEFSCAIHEDGRLNCWGNDEFHQIQDTPPGPGDVDGRLWEQIDCGHEFACALDREGFGACWGRDESLQVSDTPTVIKFRSLAAGRAHACGSSDQDGIVTCWGDNGQDQVGDDGHPVFGEDFGRLVAGADHNCVVRSNLGLKCWGSADTIGQPNSPVESPNDAGPWSYLATADEATCGIIEANDLFCWGDDSQFQVSDAPTNVQVHYVDIWDHGCAIRNSESTIVCWGKNESGQATVPIF